MCHTKHNLCAVHVPCWRRPVRCAWDAGPGLSLLALASVMRVPAVPFSWELTLLPAACEQMSSTFRLMEYCLNYFNPQPSPAVCEQTEQAGANGVGYTRPMWVYPYSGSGGSQSYCTRGVPPRPYRTALPNRLSEGWHANNPGASWPSPARDRKTLRILRTRCFY